MTYQVETLGGLQTFLKDEFKRWKNPVSNMIDWDESAIRVDYFGNPLDLTRLRTAVAVYRVEPFDIPRPKAFLGQEHLTRLLKLIAEMQAWSTFHSFRLGAAGVESSTFRRLAQEIEAKTGLPFDEKGELLIRFVPNGAHWDALFRMSARPLSARSWRVGNMEGGLNAAVAAAMVDLGGICESDRVFNPMCGSGTLLIERRRLGMPQVLYGCDIDAQALAFGYQNVAKSGYFKDIRLEQADATALDCPKGQFDLILCDLPWGDDIGSLAGNQILYPQFVREMARISSKRARMVVLTHDIRRFESVVEETGFWQIRKTHQVYHGGHHPKMYLLTKA